MIRSPLLLLALFLLGACQSQPSVRLMPPPEAFVKSEKNLFEVNQNLERSGEIQVFYATNRKPTGAPDNQSYSRTPTDDLHLGVADLSIGGGDITWEALYKLSTQANDEALRPEILLTALHEKARFSPALEDASGGEAALAFFRMVDQALAASRDQNLTIYVHGANTGVQRATAQAAQYRHFTGRNSVVLSFIWPSAESLLLFSRDVANTARTAPTFAHLVRMLSLHTRARQINVIAYSSGAMVASGGLARLDTPDPRFPQDSLRLGEVYYAAPDADFRTFVGYLQRQKAIGKRATVAINMNDSVLRWSSLHQRASRAGRPDLAELSEDDTQWLLQAAAEDAFDVLWVKPEGLPGLDLRSHTFWYDHPWVSTDLLLKMLFSLPPDERGLDRGVSAQGVPYWEFSPDYGPRLWRILQRLGEQAARKTGEGDTVKP
jgi:esterase/lipase superfamily enzyme